MTTQKKTIGIYIIASAIIWGAALIGCSLKLKGTGCFDEIWVNSSWHSQEDVNLFNPNLKVTYKRCY